jgi:hypothetical protein
MAAPTITHHKKCFRRNIAEYSSMTDKNETELPKFFTLDDTWTGGFYELAIELGSYSDQHLLDALKTIWNHSSLEGCYLDRTKEPDQQVRYNSVSELFHQREMYSGFHVQGVATLPNKLRIACGTCVIREYSDNNPDAPDWLDFYLPMGALEQAYDVGGYPFDTDIKSPENWQKPIDDYVAQIGMELFAKVDFRLGLVGHEVSGIQNADEIANEGIQEQRYIGYLWPSASQLTYFPRNKP